MVKSRQNNIFQLLLIILFFIIIISFSPFIGSQSIDYHNVLSYVNGEENPDGIVFFKIRLPRVIFAVITGASLAIAGVIFQAVLRNPLATPYTLGVSAGGALGAVIMIKLGIAFTFWGFTTIQTTAFVGSLLTILLVYYLSRREGKISIYSMILAGVTISYFFSAIILMLHFIADFTETRQMIRWMMGGLDIFDYQIFIRVIPILLFSYIIIFLQAKKLNIISTSEEIALSKGVSVANVQKIVFLFASLITGLVVALSGPIGFVGLIVPHLLRLFLGVDHRYLIPASLFFGGAFLALCDAIARTIIAPVDVPVGIITAILGGPFFLWLLVKR
jgi:iron complex transport system permease protein